MLQRNFLLVVEGADVMPGRHKELHVDVNCEDPGHSGEHSESGLQKQIHLRVSINLCTEVHITGDSTTTTTSVILGNGKGFCEARCCEGKAPWQGRWRGALLLPALALAYILVYQVFFSYGKAKSAPVLQRVVLVHEAVNMSCLLGTRGERYLMGDFSKDLERRIGSCSATRLLLIVIGSDGRESRDNIQRSLLVVLILR